MCVCVEGCKSSEEVLANITKENESSSYPIIQLGHELCSPCQHVLLYSVFDSSSAEERNIPGAAPQFVHACADVHFHSHLKVMLGAFGRADLIYMSSWGSVKNKGGN